MEAGITQPGGLAVEAGITRPGGLVVEAGITQPRGLAVVGNWHAIRPCHSMPKSLATFNTDCLTPLQWDHNAPRAQDPK